MSEVGCNAVAAAVTAGKVEAVSSTKLAGMTGTPGEARCKAALGS